MARFNCHRDDREKPAGPLCRFRFVRSQERAESFDHLKSALNETRASLGAEPGYKDE